LKLNTWLTKESIIKKKILPYFGKRKLSEITSKDILDWQNEVRGMTDSKGKLKNITQHTLLDTGDFPFFQPELAGEYRDVTWFSQAFARKAVNAGLADVMPAYYRDMM
jgi:hypothetical protein